MSARRALRRVQPVPSWTYASTGTKPVTVSDSHSREQLRQTYADAWRKHLARSPLTPLEAMISNVIGAHPEYQALMSDAQAAIAFEPNPAGDAENPFLHMGLD